MISEFSIQPSLVSHVHFNSKNLIVTSLFKRAASGIVLPLVAICHGTDLLMKLTAVTQILLLGGRGSLYSLFFEDSAQLSRFQLFGSRGPFKGTKVLWTVLNIPLLRSVAKRPPHNRSNFKAPKNRPAPFCSCFWLHLLSYEICFHLVLWFILFYVISTSMCYHADMIFRISFYEENMC